jgi:hypothetical protein
MSLVRLLPAWLHAVADYAVGGLLIIVALVAAGTAGATALSSFYVVAGVAVPAVSLITIYQYSPKREWSGGQAATA